MLCTLTTELPLECVVTLRKRASVRSKAIWQEKSTKKGKFRAKDKVCVCVGVCVCVCVCVCARV